jgi:hypothetical protein
MQAWQGAGEAPLRFWIDEYAFSEGETAILRESIDVPPSAPHCPADSPLLALFATRLPSLTKAWLVCGPLLCAHGVPSHGALPATVGWGRLGVGLRRVRSARSRVQRSPQASGGAAVLAGETRARAMTRKGYYAPGAWDVYWTGRQARPLCASPP